MKYSFESQSVTCHFDNPKKIYQIHLNVPYQWLCSARTATEARRIVKLVNSFMELPQGAQIIKHLHKNVK
jgi:hypothetical protein